MAKATTTKLDGTTGSEDLQFGGVADGFTGSEYHLKQAPVQTTDASQTTIASINLAEGEVIVVQGIISAGEDDFSQAVGGTFAAVFRRASGGDVTLVGSVDTSVKEDSGGSPSFTLQADTTNQTVDLDVTGEAATTYNWVVSYWYHKSLIST